MLIINKCIFKELVPPFFISLFFFSFVLLMSSLIQFTQQIVNYDISGWTLILMMIYAMPTYLMFIIPMSVTMSVLFTFLRMSNDNEIVTLKAGGFSIYRLLPPVLLFCFLGFLFNVFIIIYALPWGKCSFKALAYKTAISNPKVGLKERTFIDTFKGVMLHFNKMDFKHDQIEGVYIEDRRNEGTVIIVVAPIGRIINGPDNTAFYLQLSNGIINRVRLENQSVNSISFDTYELRLDINQPDMPSEKNYIKSAEEMYWSELRHYLKNAKTKDRQYIRALTEFYEKFSLPFACFALGFLAMPLGIQVRWAKKSSGLGLGLIFFLFHFILLSIGWGFSESGYYPPIIGMWLPNFIMGGLGGYFFYRAAGDHPLQINLSFKMFKTYVASYKVKP